MVGIFPSYCRGLASWTASRNSLCIAVVMPVLLATGTLSSVAQQIWFMPRSPIPARKEPLDWNEIFKPNAPWQAVSAHTDVFPFNTEYLSSVSDADLAPVIADINRRKLAIAVGMQAIAKQPACGQGLEGYGATSEVAKIAAKLKGAGATLRYIQMDNPLWNGHYPVGPTACNSSFDNLAKQIATNVAEYTAEFPDVELGESEPLTVLLSQEPTWQQDYRAWKAAVEKATGRPLRFLQSDTNWPNPAWPERLVSAAQFIRSLGMKFGVIYNGDPRDNSDAAWVTDAARHIERIESDLGLIPDQAIFTTWDSYPKRVLPETSPTALAYLPMEYLRKRTHFTVEAPKGQTAGALLDDEGRPVVSAKVTGYQIGVPANKSLPTLTVQGTVPANARSLILAVRINSECYCAGTNDLLLSSLSYKEGAGGSGSAVIDFTTGVRGLTGKDGTATAVNIHGGRAIHLVIKPSNSVLLNGPATTVTPGAPFTLSLVGAVTGDHAMFGYMGIIWFDQQHKGLSREHLDVETVTTEVGSAVTGADGRFMIVASVDGSPAKVDRLEYAGDGIYRPALKTLAPPFAPLANPDKPTR